MAHESQLILLSRARQAIGEARTLDDLRGIRDKAEAIRSYAKSRGQCFEIQQEAAEIKLRTERRMGEMLVNMNVHAGRPVGNCNAKLQLPDLGVERMQSHRWQRIASLAEPEFERYIADTKTSGRELTTAGAVSLAKVAKNQNRNVAIGLRTQPVIRLNELVESGQKFGCIYADPPWQYGNQGTRAATDNHYPTMTPQAIAALPIESLAADDAHLHLWTTNAFLFECERIIAAWGFTYKSCFVWVKTQMGIGNYWRVSHEFLLLGVRGRCTFLDRGQKSWMELPRAGHSIKPAEIRTAIEKVSPSPRLELFGRQVTSGWTVWGNEIEEPGMEAVA